MKINNTLHSDTMKVFVGGTSHTTDSGCSECL